MQLVCMSHQPSDTSHHRRQYSEHICIECLVVGSYRAPHFWYIYLHIRSMRFHSNHCSHFDQQMCTMMFLFHISYHSQSSGKIVLKILEILDNDVTLTYDLLSKIDRQFFKAQLLAVFIENEIQNWSKEIVQPWRNILRVN